jgi:hypothetical protein
MKEQRRIKRAIKAARKGGRIELICKEDDVERICKCVEDLMGHNVWPIGLKVRGI